MSECDLKIEIRQMIKNSNCTNEKAIGSIVKALKMRHADLDIGFAANVTTRIIKERQCAM
ncbi:MAG: hypothetical protein JXQ77_01515 [Campylobacterales bacterium]|nr:hypothetical protein [Campylobacterales bacterium]